MSFTKGKINNVKFIIIYINYNSNRNSSSYGNNNFYISNLYNIFIYKKHIKRGAKKVGGG